MIVGTAIGDERLHSLYHYWLDKRQGRTMPGRADLDPLEIPGRLWPHVMLLEVIPGPAGPRFRYRRAGAVFWRALGREPTGLHLDEVVPEVAGYRDYVLGIYRETFQRRLPMYTENQLILRDHPQPVTVKRVTLPLSSDGKTIDRVMTGHVFEHEQMACDWDGSRVHELKECARIVLTD